MSFEDSEVWLKKIILIAVYLNVAIGIIVILNIIERYLVGNVG